MADSPSVISLSETGQSCESDSQRRSILPALTGIRFFAAFYVVLFHSLPWLKSHFNLPRPLVIFLGNGYLAVALFFLLSGFILSYTYAGNVENARQRAKFWEARFARIYPVYFLSLMLALPFQRSLPLSTKVAVLAMVQAWNPFHREWTGAWNYPAWSLSVEAFFYLWFPFIQKRISRIADGSLSLFIYAMAVLSVFAHTPIQGLGTSGSHLEGLVLPIYRLPEFLLGVGLGNRFLRMGATSHSTFFTYLAAAAVIILLGAPIGPWVSLVVVPFAALLLELADSRNHLGGLLSSPIMILLGGASYSVYLLQAPFRDWVRVLSEHFPHAIARLATPVTPILLVLFSILVFKTWEEPSRRAIRRWLGTKPPSP
jgi:peptidoglycan/LPS O-acetylase OafA/YrhL